MTNDGSDADRRALYAAVDDWAKAYDLVERLPLSEQAEKRAAAQVRLGFATIALRRAYGEFKASQ